MSVRQPEEVRFLFLDVLLDSIKPGLLCRASLRESGKMRSGFAMLLLPRFELRLSLDKFSLRVLEFSQLLLEFGASRLHRAELAGRFIAFGFHSTEMRSDLVALCLPRGYLLVQCGGAIDEALLGFS